MRRSSVITVAVLLGSIAIGVSWYRMHRHDRPVADYQLAVPNHAQESAAAPTIELASANIATNPLADGFPDLWHARTVSPQATYGPVDNKTESLLEIVRVPLVAYDAVFAAKNSDRTTLPTAGDLLLVVERREKDLLRESRVLSCLPMPSKIETSVQLVGAPWQEESYVVFVDRLQDGLRFRIGAIDRQLGTPEVLENLLSNRSTEWPNLLKMISETREPIPFPANGSCMVNVNADESEVGHHLTIEVRDGGRATCRAEPEARRCYTIETNAWSSDVSQIPEPPWKLEPHSTKIVSVLPITRPHHVAGQPQGDQPRCLAVVRQDYRSRRPWQDYSLNKTREAIWVVECGPDCDLKEAVGVGVIHPEPNYPGAENYCSHSTDAKLIFRAELGRYFLVLGSRLYQLDLDSPLNGKPLLLPENSRDWPTPLRLFAEVPSPYMTGPGVAGGGYTHLDGLHLMCGFPLRGSLDAGVVIATARPLNSDEPIEFRHGYNFKTKAATKTIFRRTELKVSAEHRDSPPDDSNDSRPATRSVPRACELVAGSTRVLKVLPSFRTEEVSKGHYLNRSLVLAEQTYRFLPTAHDATECQGRALWVLDCAADGDLKTAIPIGLIHPKPHETESFEQVEINRLLGPNGALLALAEADDSQLSIRLFRGEFYKRLKYEALFLPSDPQQWPPQMTQITELKTASPEIHRVDFLAMLSERWGFSSEERVTIRIAGTSTNDECYRWDVAKGSWTKIVFERETSSKYQSQ